MPRRYDSTRRKAAAEQTRRDILNAALKLHWQGITEFGPLAAEAGCSEATVRKHFPTKEAIFRDCTRTHAATLTFPDLHALAAIPDPEQRLRESVSELCRIHEAMLGYAWLAAHQRTDSPALDQAMTQYEGLADAVADIVAPADAKSRSTTPLPSPDSPDTRSSNAGSTNAKSANAKAVRGLLDYLTYRALRLSGELSPETTRDHLAAAVGSLVSDPL